MHRSRANRRIAIVVGVAALLVAGGVTGKLGPVRWLYDHTVTPLAAGFAAAGSTAGEALANLTRVSQLARDNAALERENADLRQRLAADAETRSDNVLLRQQLGLDVAGAPRQATAEVVLFSPDSYRQFVTINKGSKAGIGAGMAVMSQGVLIGTIVDVQAASARIMLITDPQFKLAAKDQDTNAAGILRGQLGNGLVLDEIGQTDTVHPGDSVTTSGLGGLVPPGLLIGSVQSVNARANVVFQSAEVETEFRVSQLRFVDVVLGL
ncbi:MAG TPA: rod shape-determining protein MreC [Candidatus Saccharimonadia bacterium]|jgi:rod shape-determining protein MreC|nr:rod shape-determining protein MreC [Candidatus Saccharimonadia bacterium]